MHQKIIFILCLFFYVEIISTQAIIEKNCSITVFVHGTTIARRMLQISPLRSLMYCPQGLSLAKNLPENYHFYKIAKGCVDLSQQEFSLDRFYLFGWKSESVNNQIRLQAAKDLVLGLQQIATDYYRESNIVPKIRLIGFSHGGNVILNTVNYLPILIEGEKVDIEAWLFAIPVQRINHDCVNSNNFSKIYSIYSKKDWLQRIDPQGLCNKQLRKTHFWSDRTFDQGTQCIQVDFKVNGKSISHTYYRSIFKYFPLIQELIDEQSHELKSGMIEVDFKI